MEQKSFVDKAICASILCWSAPFKTLDFIGGYKIHGPGEDVVVDKDNTLGNVICVDDTGDCSGGKQS